jgi:AcrR family transcriptional regulator
MSAASNPKYQQILQTGRDLFWKFGFRRVSIEEVCREAGVSKMTFYKYFPNKVELAMKIMDGIFEEGMSKIQSLREKHTDPETTLKKLIQMKFEGSQGISEEFIKDLYAQPDSELAVYMQSKTSEYFARVIEVYEQGKQDGWVRKDLNIPFLLQYTRKVIEMMSEEDMSLSFPTPQDMIMEVTRLLIYGIAPRQNLK